MSTHCRLDTNGDNPVPAGYVLVEDEVTLLREFGEGKYLHVRGKTLCQWAADVCRARRWDFDYLASPLVELQQHCPGLDETQAGSLLQRLEPHLPTVPRPLGAWAVAAALWPNLFGRTEPDGRLAASWLLWLIEEAHKDEDLLVANAAAERWRANAGTLEPAYAARTAKEAWNILKAWLGAAVSTVDWPPFPLSPLPPAVVQRLREEWSVKAVSTRGAFVAEILSRRPSREVARLAADVTAQYYCKHPEDLTHGRLRELLPHLPADVALELQRHTSPDDPGDPPEELEEVLRWFAQQYLPFRMWVAHFGTEEHRHRIREVAGKFALWYLSLYAKARVGGTGVEHLSWCKAARLGQERTDYVTLLIVLDGLAYQDAEELLGSIHSGCQRLALDYRKTALAPLPTTTHFAKSALLTGVRPAQAVEEEKLGPLETKYSDVVRALNEAAPGELVIWSILEPDKTYHSHRDQATLREEVKSRLRAAALNITRLVSELPAEKKLRLVITTDHGRLLAVARRTHPVPEGMESHGRAAWGAARRDFPQEGFIAEGPMAYLHPERFGLPVECAVLMTDDSFLDAEGRKGDDAFPHGGLYPEEVLIPWIQMTRDRVPVSPQAILTGTGIANRDGLMMLQVVNPGDLPIVVTEVVLGRDGPCLRVELKVGPMASVSTELRYSPWPRPRVLAGGQAKLTYVLPNQEEHSLAFTPELTSEEMYTASEILDDLGGT